MVALPRQEGNGNRENDVYIWDMYVEKNPTCTNFRTHRIIRQRFGYIPVQIYFMYKIKKLSKTIGWRIHPVCAKCAWNKLFCLSWNVLGTTTKCTPSYYSPCIRVFILSFVAFVSPDLFPFFSTWYSTVCLPICSFPSFSLNPPPGCLGSSGGAISISFELNVSCFSSCS